MPHLAKILLLASLAVVCLAAPLRADYLRNGDLKNGISCWRGDGTLVFLKLDGSEGAEGDPEVAPAIKLTLSRTHRRYVMQEFSASGKPTTMHVKVEVMASRDFKRSAVPRDYTDTGLQAGQSGFCGDPFVPDVDFWFFLGPDFCYQLGEVKIREWTTAVGNFQDLSKYGARAINFCAPPGEGAIYLKHFMVSP